MSDKSYLVALAALNEKFDKRYNELDKNIEEEYLNELKKLRKRYNEPSINEVLRPAIDKESLKELINYSASSFQANVIIFELVSLRDINELYSHDDGQFALDFLHKIITKLFESTNINKYVRKGNRYYILIQKINITEDLQTFLIREIKKYLNNPFELIDELEKDYKNSIVKIKDEIYIMIGISSNINDTSEHLYLYAKHALQISLKKYQKNTIPIIVTTTDSDMKDINRVSIDMKEKESDFVYEDYFELYYQPQVNLITKKVSSAEVLIRMKVNQKIISPELFIPFFEETNQIVPLGRWIIQTVFKLKENSYNSNFSKELQNLKLAINLSINQLKDSKSFFNIIDLLEDEINNEAFNPTKSIYFEITETEPINSEIKKTLNRLIKKGYQIALDDFGTGFASLEHFSSLKYSILKIDKQLIQSMETNPSDYLIVQTAIILAKKLGIKVVAEGVESPLLRGKEHYRYIYRDLLYLQCDYIQGFYFSKPLLYEDLKQWINTFDISNYSKFTLSA